MLLLIGNVCLLAGRFEEFLFEADGLVECLNPVGDRLSLQLGDADFFLLELRVLLGFEKFRPNGFLRQWGSGCCVLSRLGGGGLRIR